MLVIYSQNSIYLCIYVDVTTGILERESLVSKAGIYRVKITLQKVLARRKVKEQISTYLDLLAMINSTLFTVQVSFVN